MATTQAPTLSTTLGKPPPPRIVINGVEGWGKTTIAAHIPGVAVLMAKGETGYTTLANEGRVPIVPHVTLNTWIETLAMIDKINEYAGEIKAIALDAVGGFEHLCHQYVCDTQYDGNWGRGGFVSFQEGYRASINEWITFLVKLDSLREKHGILIILLSHCQIANFKNPLGPDYDRYITDLHQKTWGVTHKWCDMVLFGTFHTVVDKDRPNAKRGKAVGGTLRVAHTERTDAYDAKNRYGMPRTLDFTDDYTESWTIIEQAMKGNK